MSWSAIVLAAAVSATPAVRSFWKLEEMPRPQPVQSLVQAELVREGDTLSVYREKGYRFSTLGEADEERQIAGAVETFDGVIYPRLVEAFGPCPDRDGNGKVILLLTRFTRDGAAFLRFDALADAEALRFGVHSNEGEVLYLSFSQQGNRAPDNLAALAAGFHRLLHHARDPEEVAWSELLGSYSAYLCGLASPRTLWGESKHLLPSPSPGDPWQPYGWPLLFVEYLRERAGLALLSRLVANRKTGTTALAEVLAGLQPPLGLGDALADFAMATWLDDPGVAAGRFALPDLAPPRPPPAARFPASRPSSGQISCSVGAVAHLLVEGDGERPLAIALRGDPRVEWVGRAVHLRQRGPDEELPLAFAADGLARLELPLLPTGDGALIAVAARPPATADFDRRRLTLLWGVGWVPRAFSDPAGEAIQGLLAQPRAAGAVGAAARIGATLERLAGIAPGADGARLATRYAWSPDAVSCLALLRSEAAARRLAARDLAFFRQAPPDITQEWRDLLIDLPGQDPRRWPIVVAAHWDAARPAIAESYARALGVDDNASGVVVALEAAALATARERRAPVIVALLAGGHHGAAGAAALLEHLQHRVALWLELDAVGRNAAAPNHLSVRIEGGEDRDAATATLAAAIRDAGLEPVLVKDVVAAHTGAAQARAHGIPALVVRTRAFDVAAADPDLPALVERGEVSPDLMALLSLALDRALAGLAGGPGGR